MRKLPEYHHDPLWTCFWCKEPGATIIADDNSFSYSGTHCTGGKDGVEYPQGWGQAVCSCCGEPVEDAEEVDYEQEESGRYYGRYQDD